MHLHRVRQLLDAAPVVHVVEDKEQHAFARGPDGSGLLGQVAAYARHVLQHLHLHRIIILLLVLLLLVVVLFVVVGVHVEEVVVVGVDAGTLPLLSLLLPPPRLILLVHRRHEGDAELDASAGRGELVLNGAAGPLDYDGQLPRLLHQDIVARVRQRLVVQGLAVDELIVKVPEEDLRGRQRVFHSSL